MKKIEKKNRQLAYKGAGSANVSFAFRMFRPVSSLFACY